MTDRRDRGDEAARAELLASVDLFKGLDRIALAKLAANLDLVVFETGEAACVQGEPGDSLYIVARGAMGVSIADAEGQGEVRVGTMRAPACFGEVALLTGEPRSATVRAVGPAEALRLDRAKFVELLRREPTIGLAISATLSRRLVAADQRYLRAEHLVGAALDHRLAELSDRERGNLLRIGVLEAIGPTTLVALFGDDAAPLADRLTAIAGGEPSPELLHMLRTRLARALDAEALDRWTADAIAMLARAGCWDEALQLAHRARPRGELFDLLSAALAPSADPTGLRAREWTERLSPDDVAAHPVLARISLSRGDEATSWAPAGHHAGGHRPRLGAIAALPTAGWRRLRRDVSPRLALVAGLSLALATAGIVVGSGAPQLAFVLLLGAAIVLWVSALLPEFAVAVGLANGWILAGLATPGEALAGYGTTSWMTALTILGLGAAIATSGLLFRFGLLLVRRMPSSLFGQAATFLLTGIILTPLLPSSTARAGLVVPLALTAAETQRLKERGPESALLGLSAYVGANPMLFTFLNGSTSCLLALGLLPEATRAHFDWSTWFIAALPLATVTALGTLAAMTLLLRPGRVVAGSRSRLSLQLSLLGRPSSREIAMSAILIATVLGWNVAPLVGLSATAVGLLGLLAAIVTGCFTRQSLQSLNWDFLVSYGVVIGLAQLAVKLGVDRVAAAAVQRLIGGEGMSPFAFVLVVALLCLVVRVFIPQDQALLLLLLALVPVAPLVGVDPWVIAIAILATFSTWFVPAQTVGYPVAYDATEGRLFTHRQARLVCAAYTAAALTGLMVSVPYWRLLGLL
jgi:CRP-like cAMP-binding protein/di/tricarboxylate transporter